MSKTNMQIYEEKKKLYPIEAIIHRKTPRPENFQKANPNVWFFRIPLADGVHWMFKSEKEMQIFMTYAQLPTGATK